MYLGFPIFPFKTTIKYYDFILVLFKALKTQAYTIYHDLNLALFLENPFKKTEHLQDVLLVFRP